MLTVQAVQRREESKVTAVQGSLKETATIPSTRSSSKSVVAENGITVMSVRRV